MKNSEIRDAGQSGTKEQLLKELREARTAWHDEFGVPVSWAYAKFLETIGKVEDALARVPGPQKKEYMHFLVCSGSRQFPAGEPGHSCSCFNGLHRVAAPVPEPEPRDPQNEEFRNKYINDWESVQSKDKLGTCDFGFSSNAIGQNPHTKEPSCIDWKAEPPARKDEPELSDKDGWVYNPDERLAEMRANMARKDELGTCPLCASLTRSQLTGKCLELFGKFGAYHSWHIPVAPQASPEAPAKERRSYQPSTDYLPAVQVTAGEFAGQMADCLENLPRVLDAQQIREFFAERLEAYARARGGMSQYDGFWKHCPKCGESFARGVFYPYTVECECGETITVPPTRPEKLGRDALQKETKG